MNKYRERHDAYVSLVKSKTKPVIISPKEQQRRNEQKKRSGYVWEEPDEDQDIRIRYADELLLAVLHLQSNWTKVVMSCSGQNVGVIGAGLSLYDLDPEHLRGMDALFSANSAANAVQKIRGPLPLFAVHQDEMPDPEIRINPDMFILSSLNVRLHPLSSNIVILPDAPILKPMGCQSLCVWLARLAGAKSITMFCCDSVLGDNARWEETEPVSYAWHPGCTMTIAKKMPVSWVCPGWDKPIPSPRKHKMSWGTNYMEYRYK